MKPFLTLELWFVTGSQHLYGATALQQVAHNATTIAASLNAHPGQPVSIVCKPIVTTAEQISACCTQANAEPRCIGLIFWMHTFSPAQMWIEGLGLLAKPFVHLHTQFNSALPWESIDMDFMNLNQSAHGGREFGFMVSRMGIAREVIVGHWQDSATLKRLGDWSRVAMGAHELRRLKVARIGDNMRNVAVTEGNKVSARMRFGVSVCGYGIGDVIAQINAISDADVKRLVDEYKSTYTLGAEVNTDAGAAALAREARVELGLLSFLQQGGFGAFTDTFEDLHGLEALPGLATQRLMAQGYGFGAKGDWKTAALLRVAKVMSSGLDGGTSFMEDYTYHFDKASDMVLGAHMLEVCPSIAAHTPQLSIHPLGIGGKQPPVRLIFTGATGPALNASLIDMGHRFRLILNKVDAVEPPGSLPKLPVARALWKPQPSLSVAAEAWIRAGGAHHTVYSQSLGSYHFEQLAELFGIECVCIDESTQMGAWKQLLRTNEVYYRT
jgi:L-arabinose isomerase